MRRFLPDKFGNKGSVAIEFATLLPIFLFLFFAMMEFAWYFVNVMMVESAVANGARAGVKVKYWSSSTDEDPVTTAISAVKANFWWSKNRLEENSDVIQVIIKDKNNQMVDMTDSDYNQYKYLEVRIIDFEYPVFIGYLSRDIIPGSISAASLMAFP